MDLSGILYSPTALPPGKNITTHLNGRLGGQRGRSERFGEEKIIWTLKEFEPQTGQAVASALADSYIQTLSTVSSRNLTIQTILKYLDCGWHINGTDLTSEAKKRTKNPKPGLEE